VKNKNITPVIKGASYYLAHVPSMVRHGSKPVRLIENNPSLLKSVLEHTWEFEKAVRYPPNQVFIGNLDPDELFDKAPWYKNLSTNGASRWGEFGEMMPEDEFYGILQLCDEFKMLSLEKTFLNGIIAKLKEHPMVAREDIAKIEDRGVSMDKIEEMMDEGYSLPLYVQRDRLIGCITRLHEEDASLVPDILLENLSVRASAVMAVRHLIGQTGPADEIDYMIGCGEEAVGERYQRGGGNIAKAVGELCGCTKATGSDLKAFCCAPVHALIVAAGLVSSGIFKNVVVLGGCSFAKLGMKSQGHLKHDMPILEDVLAATAIWVGQDDGKSPVIRLDSIGKHEISSGSAQQAIFEKLVIEPLDRLGLKLTDIDKFATEMHNPEVTEPQGSGNVPKTNYRTIGSFAVLRNEIKKDDLDDFVKKHGMPGFSPTQGHIASAIPVLGHSLRKMKRGEMERTLFLAKGSLFLGRMTMLSDGVSFLLERNK
jgi:betaine reductase